MSGEHKTPDPKSAAPSDLSGTHLAHWPPPRHQREAPAMLKVKHPGNEAVKRSKPRGWRLTRAMFSEFADDEE
jgi:hypothetical protein